MKTASFSLSECEWYFFLFESKSKFYFGREKEARMQVLRDRILG